MKLRTGTVPKAQRRYQWVLLALVTALPHQAKAFGSEGHRLVATLAERQLSERAQSEVARLLAIEPGATLASVSTWADETRAPTTAAWHYVNLPRDADCQYEAARDCPDGNCVVGAYRATAPGLDIVSARCRAAQGAEVHRPLCRRCPSAAACGLCRRQGRQHVPGSGLRAGNELARAMGHRNHPELAWRPAGTALGVEQGSSSRVRYDSAGAMGRGGDFYIKRALEGPKQEATKCVKAAAADAVGGLTMLKDYRFVAKTLRVRESASSRARSVGELRFGQTIRVLVKQKDFTLIQWSSPDGSVQIQGWVFSRYLRRFD